ncbi:G6PE protein, partial [Erithacus rubecula]|nr:G6PE protein [Erithacus rubecula]
KMLGRVLCTVLFVGALPSPAAASQGHISVVLLGATGDLAKKYLWQGLFQLYMDQVSSGHSFTFHGAALAAQEPGQRLMFDVLKRLSCPPDEPPNRCAVLKDQFLKLSQYHQLKTAENYTALSREIERLLLQEGLQEAGRIFYFSVPPFAYTEIAQHISSSCRPPAGAWLRVVLEKPFGHDLQSAQQLAAQLAGFFKEEEMYRVDHYLGKQSLILSPSQAVAHILPFRDQNRQFLDPIWNRHHVERVEVVLKETVDAKGRTSFYERYGVIRDVLQNHLTEALLFLTMELPANLSSAQQVLQHKLQALQSLWELQRSSAVLGQYQAYDSQVQEELQEAPGYISTTPTFAGVLIQSHSPRWEGVPFLLTSGKALDERVGYARVLFKNRAYCPQSGTLREAGHSHCKPKQIIFYFGHGALGTPAVLVSRNLFQPAMPKDSWKAAEARSDLHVFGQPLSDFYVYSPAKERDAYSVLISNIYHGRKDFFITTENLLASWAFWTPLLDSTSRQPPRLYPGGVENQQLLDFEMVGGGLAFTLAEPAEPLSPGGQMPSEFRAIRSTFRQSPLVSAWAEELIAHLASDMEEAARSSVARSGQFHLALSGGSSPVGLFQRLARHHFGFPWQHTHVWLVDERCVPLSHGQSNFQGLQRHLLQHVRVPYLNIHPMPVQLNGRLCVEEDGGARLYAQDIAALVPHASLDLVLLGVGPDGHTASLFPRSPRGLQGAAAVVLTESPAKPHQRMSLSLPLINRARQVFVLVLGKGKHDITTLLSRVGHEPSKWPISGVSPSSGQLVWYMDYEALLG